MAGTLAGILVDVLVDGVSDVVLLFSSLIIRLIIFDLVTILLVA